MNMTLSEMVFVAVIGISFTTGVLMTIAVFALCKKKSQKKQTPEQKFLTEEEDRAEQLRRAALDAETLQEAALVYRASEPGSEAEEIALQKCRCPKARCESINLVLQAKTPKELAHAKQMAEICGNKTAINLVAVALEAMARRELDDAVCDAGKIIQILEYAPPGDEAQKLCFLRLQQLQGNTYLDQ